MKNIANWILAAIQIVVTFFSGLIGHMFKKEFARIDALEKRIGEIEKDIADNYVKKCDCKPVNNDQVIRSIKELELRITREFVRKSDYNYQQNEVMKKLDKIQDILMERK